MNEIINASIRKSAQCIYLFLWGVGELVGWFWSHKYGKVHVTRAATNRDDDDWNGRRCGINRLGALDTIR